MRVLATLVLNLLICTMAYAEPWVCYDATSKRVTRAVIGDGLILGITGVNNSNIIDNCILATPTEYEEAKKSLMKVDPSIVGSSRVIRLTQAEIDALADAEAAAAAQAEKDAYNAMIDRVKAEVDAPDSEYGMMMEVVTDIIQAELHAIKDGTPNPKADKLTLKAAAKQKLEALKK